MRIYLIGMPGSGKSTLGRELASELKIPFFDLDDAIEKKKQKTIKEIFSNEGEEVFRKVEADTLRELTTANTSFIMSTGGGVPCYHDNLEYMNDHGLTLYLKVSPLELERRLRSEHQTRPLLARETPLLQAISGLLKERHKYYEKASYAVASDSISLKDIKNLLSKT